MIPTIPKRILNTYVTNTPKRKQNHTYRVRMPTNVFVASFAEFVACSVSTRFLSATSRYKLAQPVRHTRTRTSANSHTTCTLSTSAFVATFVTFVTHRVSLYKLQPHSYSQHLKHVRHERTAQHAQIHTQRARWRLAISAFVATFPMFNACGVSTPFLSAMPKCELAQIATLTS
jgi:hypothetical protein